MKRVIIFNAGSAIYGSERGLINFVKAIKDKVRITVVLAVKGPLEEKLKAIIPDARIIIFPLPILTFSFSPFYIVKSFLFSICGFIYFMLYIIFKRIDLVVTNSLVLFLPGLIAKATGKKHLWYVREFSDSNVLNKILRLLVKGFSDKRICQSEAIMDKLSLRNMSSMVYEPLSRDDYKIYDYYQARKDYGFSASATIITILSRVHPLKGQYEFIKYFQDYLSKHDNLFLIIAGDISLNTFKSRLYKRKLESFIRRNRLKNVFLLGYREDIDRILCLTDICLFPFRREEPFGIAVAESLAFGRKAFYPRRGGLKEVYKIFGEGSELNRKELLAAISESQNNRPPTMNKLNIPDILSFDNYRNEIINAVLG